MSGTTIWVVADAEWDQNRAIHGVAFSEHDAYAVAGRTLVERGSGSTVVLETFEVTAAPVPQLPTPVPALPVPWFVREKLNESWYVDDGDDDSPALRAGQRWVSRFSVGGLTSNEDQELAEWLAALVNRELGR